MRQLHYPGEYKCSLKETGKYIGSYFSVGENLVLLRCDVDPEALPMNVPFRISPDKEMNQHETKEKILLTTLVLVGALDWITK